ncbi:MAG: glycosyltransferase family 9 protein [Phascolarctobacterium sp.]|nr:glycosyltransferase family 9 protein [Phascolarctobacterium sp.]
MVELNGKKILVTFLMHLGDLTLTTPFIHALRKAAPDAHITFLADEKLKDVILYNPYLDEVITIDKKGRDNSLLALIACARRLSGMDFDVVINLHPNERCSFICALTKTKLRVGTTHTMFRPMWDQYIQLDRTIHAADMYLDVLHELGVTNIQHNGLEIFPSVEHMQQAENFWRDNGVFATDRLVGFNIGSAVVTKRWAPDRFAKVADAMAFRGYKPVFFGGTMDEAMVQEAVSFMQTTPIVATGAFTIGALAAAMRRCSLIITNDSGPMHVAISQKVPIVAMYGPSSPKLYGPYTKDATIVTAVPPCMGCAGGMKHKCDDMQCMTRLTVDQVVEAAVKMLAQNGRSQ